MVCLVNIKYVTTIFMNPQTDSSPELLTIKQASELLNCHPNTLRLWEERGIVKALRIGNRKDRRFVKQDILNLLNKSPNDLVKKITLPSNYDLTRIDMTGTLYEGIHRDPLIEHTGYRNLDKEVISHFDFKDFIKGFNDRINYFTPEELSKYNTVAEKILHIITSSRYRNGTLETINLDKYQVAFLKKLNHWIQHNKPVEFMLPAFPFKVANPLKSMRRDADLAEVGSFCRFNEINLQIRKVYKPGAVFHVFHDGHLYYRHFLHEEVDADRYLESLNHFIKKLGLEKIVIMHDAFHELEDVKEFSDVYSESRVEMDNLWKQERASNEKIQRIIASAKANVNLSNISYEELYKISFSDEWDLSKGELQLKREVNERAEKCAFEYMVVQHALEKIGFFEAKVPNGIRLTVHPKEGQIGIFLVKRKTHLLPWMGVGVLKNNGEVSVHYESELLSSTKYNPVFIKGEKFPFYFKEAEVIYQGTQEFRKLFDIVTSSLGKKDYYWAFAFHDEYLDHEVRDILADAHSRLAQKGIQDRAICRTDVLSKVKEAYLGNTNIKIATTDTEIPIGVIILKDRVINLLWGKLPAAYEIKTKEVVARYQKLFSEVWKVSRQ